MHWVIKLFRYINKLRSASTRGGVTFGIPHEKYKNTYQLFSLGRTVKYDAVFTPGPGRYDCAKKIGDKK